jgi:hypothetical protein
MAIDVRRTRKTVLYLGQRSRGTSGVFMALGQRSDLRIVQVSMASSAVWRAPGLPADLIVVGPEVSLTVLCDLLATVERLRPGVPVMALRSQVDGEGPSAPKPSLTVVACRCPAPVLLHLVDMALGVARPLEPVHGSSLPN